MSRPWSHQLDEVPKDGPDYRWAGPVESCVCGCETLWTLVRFHERKPSWYAVDVRCASCGAHLIAPTEADDALV